MSFFFDESVCGPLFTRFPYLRTPLQHWAHQRVGELSASFQTDTPKQLSVVAQNVLYSMVFPLFGDVVATALVESLRKSSRIMAAHHLGIDCLPELVQYAHFGGLQKLLQPTENISIIPILACSGVALQSFTYPRGLMLSSQIAHGASTRFPLFPSSMQDTLVYAAPALQKQTTLMTLNRWKNCGVSKKHWKIVNSIVNDFLLHKDCLQLDDFSKQILYCNEKIFKAIYPDNPNTHVMYLNLEVLARELLIHDIEEGNNSISLLLFNSHVREQVLKGLVNTRGCWKEEALRGQYLERTGDAGTVFFWGIDAMCRRIPLSIVDDGVRGAKLFNKDIEIPLEPECIVDALRNKRIYSSLFTSFMTVHMQHNIFCLGGIYMSQYLSTMINTVQSILDMYHDGVKVDLDFANKISKTVDTAGTYRLGNSHHHALAPSDILCSGLISVQCQHSDGTLTPAGSIELMAHGGLTRNQLLEIAEYKAKDVLPLTLKEWTLQHVPYAMNDASLVKKLVRAQGSWAGLVLPE